MLSSFSSAFKDKNKKLSKICYRKYLLVLFFIIFYHNSNTVVYEVIGYIIYTSIDNFICLDFLGVLQQNVSSYDNHFEK